MSKYKLYARVSDKSQNLASQIRDLKRAHPSGVLYQEKLSGVSRSRPAREKMLEDLEPGQVVVAVRMSRLSRSMQDLFEVVAKIEKKGCHIRFIHEDIRTDTTHGRLVFGIMASINSYSRELINDSCTAGREVAMANGVKFGKPRKIKPAQEKLVRKLKAEGKTYAEITEATGIKKGSLYLILNPEKRKQYNKSHKIYLSAQRKS